MLRPSSVDKVPRTRVRLGLGVVAAVGASSSVTAGFVLFAGAQQKYWSVDLGLRGDVPGSQPTAGLSLSSSLLLATVTPCARLSVVALCGLLAAGGQLGAYRVAEETRSVAAPFFAGGGRVALEIPWGKPLERFSVQFHGDVLAAFNRSVLESDGVVVGRTPPVSGTFGVSLIGLVR